ncbi:flagellar biosynthesis protein FliA [Clostridium sp. W14A]|uniref:Sigma-70 family RNA polymerase sigma factor n=1 Tax=Caproicibacter fermentans TaxID=2576756 RepID=A0A7G8TD99_9FIRM|nr:sigma-70 family RNA polymerase sigma factor [Caproicibacter fermentans]OCN00946.1 flagellar biosynthesis protein FliA [Clostridium sp. W14A]QNK41590.1 sigma-70 family RNA polymerase sigma factor [Caproicibacter fermentans]
MDRDQAVRENIGLVHSCARHFRGRGVEYDDLFQAGCLGLVKAVDHFDPDRGVKFSTYAVPVILGEIRRLFRDGGAIKVGRGLKELSLRATRLSASFLEREGRSPTIQELADLLEVEPEQAAEALGAAQLPISLTATEEDGGGQIDVGVESNDDKIAEMLSLKQVVTELEPRDRSIIIFRYFQNRTQTETASALGMTQVQVSRREKKILKELQLKLS